MKKIVVLLLLFILVNASANAQSSPYLITKTLTHGGLSRVYCVHLPKNYSKTKTYPLLLGFHGTLGSPQYLCNMTGFNYIADEKGFIVVYPQGVNSEWNDGRLDYESYVKEQGVNDVAFVSTLIDTLCKQYKIDKKRIYATGMSSGGMLAHLLAVHLPDKIAAIATVSAPVPKQLSVKHPNIKPVPVLMIAGTEDPILPFRGGVIIIGGENRGSILSIPDSATYWIKQNHLPIEPKSIYLPNKSIKDGTTTQVITYAPAKPGPEVVVYIIEGGGHTWPGGSQYLPELLIGKTCYDFSASNVIWDFLSTHSK